MAGNFEGNILKKSGRKKWTLFRGTKGLFQRVGTDMAEDGCPDAQFKLAKELLSKPCDSPSEDVENAREGIYWLLRASEQGHVEATELLRQCLEDGKGITEHNISEVIECLETTRNEKLSVKAIKDLFMNFSEGEEFITSNQLLSKLREVETIEMDTRKLPQIEANSSQIEDWKGRVDQASSHKLTEDVLVSAARTYSRGELPIVGQSLVLPERAICRSKYISNVFRILLFPLAFERMYSYLLSINPYTLLSLLYLSPSHLKILILLFAYNTFNFETVFSVLPTLVHYISFFVMIAATCQMLKYRKRFRHFRCWSNLFLVYGGENFSPEEAEFLHCRNGLSAYIWFFVFLLVNLFIQSFTTVTSSFQAEVTFTAFLFTALTVCSFSFTRSRYITNDSKFDYLGLFSFMLHVLAKYPYETDSVVGVGWRFLDLQIPTFASYVVGHGVEFCLNFRAFFYLIIPAVLFKMASRYQWRGVYTDFIPHCVTLSWWQLTLIYAQDATWYSLIRPSLALVGIVFFLPLTILTSIFLPLFAFAEYILEHENLWIIATTLLVAFGVPFLLMKKFFKNRSPKTFSLFTVVQATMSIIATLFLLSKYDVNVISSVKSSINETPYVDISEFTNYCSSFQTPYTDSGRIEAQLTCSQLQGLPVYWKGKVKKTRMTKISNPVATFSNKLPSYVSQYLNCWLGEEYPLCGDSFRLEFCKTLTKSCHLGNWNSYEFEIDIEVNVDDSRSLPVTLVAGSTFYNFSRKLSVDDEIWFTGAITGGEDGIVSSSFPRVDISSIACISCLDFDSNEATHGTDSLDLYIYNYVKYLLNFLFNPLVIFK